MAEVWDTTDALKKAIRAARGPMSQEALGEKLGRDKKTIIRMEKGEEGTLGKNSAARRVTALVIADATGRPDLFGLSEPEPTEVDQLKQVQLDQGKAQLRLSEELAAVRTSLEETRTRLEHLERGGEGANS